MADTIKVACIIGPDFEDVEFRKPYDAMKEAGYDITLIGRKAGEEVEGKRGTEKVRTDAGIDEVNPKDFDVLFIPGGYSPDNLRADERFVRFVSDFDRSGKWIAAICHGPQLLLSAGLVEGRTLTAWRTVQKDLELAGANVEDEPVVVDRNWITSREPGDLEKFSRAVVERVKEAPRRAGFRVEEQPAVH